MEGAVSFAVPGSAGIAMGATGLMAAAFSSLPAFSAHWLIIWLVAAAAAGVLGSILVVRESSLRGLRLAGTPLRKFALCLLPSLFAGVVLTAVNLYYGNFHAIPGTWMLLYGCALLAASAQTTRIIGAMGSIFALFGLIALVLPDGLQVLMLGAGFGGLHVIFGFLIGRLNHGRQT